MCDALAVVATFAGGFALAMLVVVVIDMLWRD